MVNVPLKPQDSSPKPLISLTTDFGTQDTYVAQMKGVIAGIAPDAKVIDATHHLPPHDLFAGALALDTLVDAFPDGTIHVAVIDPGVGSDRAAVAVKTESFMLIGPDNGLFTLVLERYPPTAIVRLTNPDYHRIPVSQTFHGRDIFAPAAAHLANGVDLKSLGESATTLVNLNIPTPEVTGNSLTARILYIDRFGNLITNLRREDYETWLSQTNKTNINSRIKKHKLGPLRCTFAEVEQGEPLIYFGSSDRLEVAIREGSAATALKVNTGTRLILEAN